LRLRLEMTMAPSYRRHPLDRAEAQVEAVDAADDAFNVIGATTDILRWLSGLLTDITTQGRTVALMPKAFWKFRSRANVLSRRDARQ
jgi:hypothetical protein